MRCLNYENENLNIGGTNVSRFTSNRITMISNQQIQTQMINTLYMDLGDCIYNCQYCGVFFWFNEKSHESTKPKFNLCCKNGKIKLPLLKEAPPILNNLLNYNGGHIIEKILEP